LKPQGLMEKSQVRTQRVVKTVIFIIIVILNWNYFEPSNKKRENNNYINMNKKSNEFGIQTMNVMIN
jgi:hypothetical protein